MQKLLSPAYNGGGWHPDRPPIKVTGPTCSNCKRPLIITDSGTCLCCGQEA